MTFLFINCFIAICILNTGRCLSVPPRMPSHNNGYNYNYWPGNSSPLPVKKPAMPELPIELQVNFTFPANGLPPMKVNLGNVAEYLTEKPGIPSSPKRVVLVNIKNPNRPIQPIPSEVYAAGLPVGALIPGDVIQPCKNFIVSKCNELCFSTRDTCRSLCDGRADCLSSCKVGFTSCKKFCDSSFIKEKEDELEIPKESSKIYLPKCLRNCKGNATCNDKCHDICHRMLDMKPENNGFPYSYIPAGPVAPLGINEEIGASIKEGDFTDNNQDEEQR